MLSRFGAHVRGNLVGYLALFVALGGTAIAAKPLVTGAGIQDGSITDADIAAANKDGTAGTPSLRTLGTGAQQAAAGNDARLSNARTPTGAAGGDLTGTYPSPTIAAGAIGTSAFSSNIPVVRVLGGGVTVPASGAAKLSFDVERYDSANLHDMVTNPSRLTAPVSGVYSVTANVIWQENSTGDRQIEIAASNNILNVLDRVPAVGGGNRTEQDLSTEYKLAAGDFVELFVGQTSGTPLLASGRAFTMSWVAPG